MFYNGAISKLQKLNNKQLV